MVRLLEPSERNELRGRLSGEFQAITLASLHSAFVTADADTSTNNAAQVLDQFYRAAARLHSREKEFNRRAKPATPSLLTYLREPAHSAAQREFNKAKERLLEINTQVGEQIIHLAERGIDASVRAAARTPLPAPSLN